MKVLLIGAGGREHALAWALHNDPAVEELIVAPGNPGIAEIATLESVDQNNPVAVRGLAERLGVNLVIIGPEAPLVAGVANEVRKAGIPVFGPDAEAAQIEGSKAFAKEIMAVAGVPTGMARVADRLDQVAQALDAFGAPYVVKDDGLAAGKGVVVTSDRAAALAHAQTALTEGSGTVVIEEHLAGPEVSLFVLSDGEHVIPLEPAQDFKRIYDNDEGPNTGGMGAYTPLPWAPENIVDEVVTRVAQPVISRLAKRGTPFVGVLYCGLALTSRGIRVIEFNARFGDPEIQEVLARLRTPLGELLLAAATGELASFGPLHWRPEAAVGVVLASPGYPEKPELGGVITGLDTLAGQEDVLVFHAGTAQQSNQLVTSGGRVLTVVGLGDDLQAAQRKAYAAIAKIRLENGQYRKDIAQKAIDGQISVPAASSRQA